ncbi:MAG TPA: rRNA (guanine-N2)-methyltransferase [Sediminispirochaeta sp.]|nr:rRNA (guanine-N2)-methyltransferase [Sediminispirochaeta sp.]
MDTRVKIKDFGKLLKRNHQKYRGLFDPRVTDCFRVYHWNIASIPWFIDFYGEYLHIMSYARKHSPEIIDVEEELLDEASRMLYVPRERIFFKHRFVQGKKEQQQKLDEKAFELVVRENDLKFKVNLSDYMDTGLFLDHRLSRQMLRDSVMGREVLNLFAYTGSFSVYAAAGGASGTVSVDLSSSYLSWARENMELNGFSGGMHRFVARDARTFLEEAVRENRRYGIIILDPPTFSNSRKMDGTFDLQRDYVWFIGQALKLLTKDGVLFFSTNYHRFHFDPGRIKGALVDETTRETTPEDFSGKRKSHRSWVIRPSR